MLADHEAEIIEARQALRARQHQQRRQAAMPPSVIAWALRCPLESEPPAASSRARAARPQPRTAASAAPRPRGPNGTPDRAAPGSSGWRARPAARRARSDQRTSTGRSRSSRASAGATAQTSAPTSAPTIIAKPPRWPSVARCRPPPTPNPSTAPAATPNAPSSARTARVSDCCDEPGHERAEQRDRRRPAERVGSQPKQAVLDLPDAAQLARRRQQRDRQFQRHDRPDGPARARDSCERRAARCPERTRHFSGTRYCRFRSGAFRPEESRPLHHPSICRSARAPAAPRRRSCPFFRSASSAPTIW